MGRTPDIDHALEQAFGHIVGPDTPPRLAAALHHAVFPGGARFRPELVLAVADACGARSMSAARHAACAVELVHCASLVHDDLPCFDNALIRRGRASVHAKYGEALAVLVGDGLIVGAFAELGVAIGRHGALAGAVAILARAVGTNGGLVAGQAWEGELMTTVQRYHRAKTAVLFEAATCIGAIAGGAAPEPWRELGATIGEAYQLADDLADLVATPTALGKPVGQDLLHGRPSAALELGVERAFARLDEVVARIAAAVPPGPRADELRAWLRERCALLFPRPAAPRHDSVHGDAAMSA
jgi:geranylgeranyl diphosphate synthase type II